MDKSKIKVFVGVSGGVDSSVSAAILKDQGYDVTGVYMKNWKSSYEPNPEDSYCSYDDDLNDAKTVCGKLGIPFYSIDLSEEYKNRVFDPYVENLKKGITPNPDILCNKYIKFDVFAKKVMSLGADYIATGHYCRIGKFKDEFSLQEAEDQNKDQTYFLYSIDKKWLSKTIFPIGELNKSDVRKIASEKGLHNHDKKDSVGICFIGKRKFSDFISGFIPDREGDILDTKGNFVGKHTGLHKHTIGQRKGIGVGSKDGAYFVARKDIEKNQLIVSHDLSDLISNKCKITDVNILFPLDKVDLSNLHCKIRYRSKSINCSYKPDTQEILFDADVKAITSGQSAVLYYKNNCIGGGIIE